MKPHKISTHSSYSDSCHFHFCYGLSDWFEILWGVTKFFFKPILKISAFYLEKQKSFIPKKLSCCRYQNKKALFTSSIFLGRFWYFHDSFCGWLLQFIEARVSCETHETYSGSTLFKSQKKMERTKETVVGWLAPLASPQQSL